jgi:hypothetical protein
VCPNNRTIIVNGKREYEFASEEEQDAIDEGQLEDALKMKITHGFEEVLLLLLLIFECTNEGK